ncbi:hypothetical protein ACVIIV_003293 [Bradyrhizobium sp. USDA 4354]
MSRPTFSEGSPSLFWADETLDYEIRNRGWIGRIANPDGESGKVCHARDPSLGSQRFLAVLAKLPLQTNGLIGIVSALQQGAAFIT